jgi:hypothetical protein
MTLMQWLEMERVSNMYESGYNKLFWGMIFVIFNINIGIINLLPNFIGYILIFSGLSILSAQHSIYEKGKTPAVILTIITAKDIVNLGNANILSGQYPMDNLWFSAIGMVESLINLYLIFIICKGIYLLAEGRGLTELRNSAKERFLFYLGISVVYHLFNAFSMNLPRDTIMAIILVAIINIIALLYIAGLFRKSRTQLGE